MTAEKIKSFTIVGISMRTTNENGQSQEDIPALWNTFITDKIGAQIQNKVDSTIYCLYSNYEKDHTKPYDVCLGYKIIDGNEVPEGMVARTIAGADFTKFTAHGDIKNGSVFNEWVKIWNSDIPRSFIADFEVYGAKAFGPYNAEVDIFIGIN